MSAVTIYIPKEKEQLWQKVKEIAKKEKRAVGYIVLEIIEKSINKKEIF